MEEWVTNPCHYYGKGKIAAVHPGLQLTASTEAVKDFELLNPDLAQSEGWMKIAAYKKQVKEAAAEAEAESEE